MKKTIFFFSTLTAFFFLIAFNQPQKPITSLKDMKKVLKAGYAFIPSGTTVYNGDTVSLQGFFIQKTEVSNFNYLEYLSYLRKNESEKTYLAALPDSNQWKQFSKEMIRTYFRNSKYREYPVINLTRKQAKNYCVWLTKIWQQNTGNKKIKFRLPLRVEFIRAANSDGHSPYAWSGPFLRNETGDFVCNFHTVSQESIYRDPLTHKMKIVESNKARSINFTAPVKSYFPNEFGLYNLNGNVAEMVQEKNTVVGGDWNSGGHDVRNRSYKIVEGSSPMIGFRPVMTYVK